MNPFKKLVQGWQRGPRVAGHRAVEMFDEDRTLAEVAKHEPEELSYVEWEALAAERGVELDQVAEYMRLPVDERPLTIEGENERSARHEAFIEASYDDELSLTDEATVMPGNLSYANWCELATQRGVELDQLPEWAALDPVQRPLSPEAEAERDAREEAYVEQQLREAYEADAHLDPVVEAAQQALDQDSGPGARGRIVPFEHQGERLYVRDHGRGEMQVLTADEAAADPEWNAERVEDIATARLQAIADEATLDADRAMPKPPANRVSGQRYDELWSSAEAAFQDRYAERVAELEFTHGCDAGEVRAEQERLQVMRRIEADERDAQRRQEREQQAEAELDLGI